MNKNKLSLNFLYNRLDALEMNLLISKYHFFIVYNDLKIQKKAVNKKSVDFTKTRFFLKTIIKIFTFSYFFEPKTFKYPLFIQLTKTSDFFESVILNLFINYRKNLQIKYNSSIFSLKNRELDFFNNAVVKLKDIYSFGTLNLDFFFVN